MGGISKQEFDIGSGYNFNADVNFWIEIIYSINGVQIFYTRNILHHMRFYDGNYKKQEELLEKFASSEEEELFTFGDILPNTEVVLTRKKHISSAEKKRRKSIQLIT